MEQPKLVFPGDELAVAEEFVPGPGTFEDNGTVYACWIGEAMLDTDSFTASVRPRTKVPAVLRPGDIVVGRVTGIRTSFAIVRVVARADEPQRDVASSTNGTLHIAKVSHEYLDRIEDALRLGDIVRARVLEAKPAVQLTTKSPELGVLLARCPRCRTEMEARGHGLVCPGCDWKARAKLAVDYGEGLILPPDNVEERGAAREQQHREAGIVFPSAGPGSDRTEKRFGRGGGGDRRGGDRRGGDRRGGDRRGGGGAGRGFDRGGRGGDRRGGGRRRRDDRR